MYDATHHFDTLYTSVPREFEFRASTREGWITWREMFRPRLRRALGLENIESDLRAYQSHAEMVLGALPRVLPGGKLLC